MITNRRKFFFTLLQCAGDPIPFLPDPNPRIRSCKNLDTESDPGDLKTPDPDLTWISYFNYEKNFVYTISQLIKTSSDIQNLR